MYIYIYGLLMSVCNSSTASVATRPQERVDIYSSDVVDDNDDGGPSWYKGRQEVELADEQERERVKSVCVSE